MPLGFPIQQKSIPFTHPPCSSGGCRARESAGSAPPRVTSRITPGRAVTPTQSFSAAVMPPMRTRRTVPGAGPGLVWHTGVNTGGVPSVPPHSGPAPCPATPVCACPRRRPASCAVRCLVLGSFVQAAAEDFPALSYLPGCPSVPQSLTRESQATSTTLRRGWSPGAAGRGLAPAPAAMRSSASPARPSGPPSRIAPLPWPPAPEPRGAAAPKAEFRGSGHSVRLDAAASYPLNLAYNYQCAPGGGLQFPACSGKGELHLPPCPRRKGGLSRRVTPPPAECACARAAAEVAAAAEGAAGEGGGRGRRVATRRGGLARPAAPFPVGLWARTWLPGRSAGPGPTRGPGWMGSLPGPAQTRARVCAEVIFICL